MMKQDLVRKVWQAWARFTRLSWELVSKHEKGTLTDSEYRKLIDEDRECNEARFEMYCYDCECDRRGIAWLNLAKIDPAASAARREHLEYSRMIWEHLAH